MSAPTQREEPIDARIYRHASLGDRRLVRLEPRSIGDAIDLEMAVHAFEIDGVREGVSVGIAALEGFVAWVARHDAKNVRAAIAQRRELERALRKGRSKPGHAKDAIEAQVKKIASASPTWVAPFCDEASRGMTALGNATYAALFFSRARQAERASTSRTVKGRDADATAQLYLDAALRGALSAKEIAHYVEDVIAREGARGAHARLRELLVRRTLGGVPPWASAMDDLAKIAPGTDREKAEDLERLAGELVVAPAMARAPLAMWKMLAPSIAALAARDPSVHEALLRIVPAMGRRPFDGWFEILERTGSLAHLATEISPEEIARFVTRTVEAVSSTWADPPVGLLEVLSRTAPRLVASGTVLSLASERAPDIDLGLAERALAHGISISVDTGSVEDTATVDLFGWARGARDDLDDNPSTSRPRVDPVHVVAHPVLGPMVEQAFEHASRSSEVLRACESSTALASLQKRWLVRQVERICTAPVAEVLRVLDTIGEGISRKSFDAEPALHARLAAHQVASSLEQTLRAGLLDELHWPALDEALAELGRMKGTEPPELFASWPELVAVRGHRLLVIGGQGISRRVDLPLAKGERVDRAETAEGDVLVVVRARGSSRAFWLDAKTECRPQYGGARYRVQVEGVGVTSGGPALRAGASAEPQSARDAMTDGTTIWSIDRQSLVEIDPRTGAKGRASRPRMLEGPGELLARSSFLVPAPAGAKRSPLGVLDGMLGLRVAADGNALTLERIDGARERITGRMRGALVLVDMPARAHRLVVSCEYGELESELVRGDGQTWVVESREPPDDDRAQPPPSQYLHFHVPADPDGSRALAAIDRNASHALVELARRGNLEDPTRARGAIKAVLPSVTHVRLLDAIAREARAALEAEESLSELVSRCDPSAEEPAAEALTDDDVEEAPGHTFSSGGMSGELERSLKRLVQAFAAFDRAEALPRWGSIVPTGVDLGVLVGRRGTLACLASSPAVAPEHRATLTTLLELLESSELSRWAPRLRTYRAKPGPRAKESVTFSRAGEEEQVALGVWGTSLHFLTASTWGRLDWTGLELRREDTAFEPLLDCAMSDEKAFALDTIPTSLAPMVRERGVRRVVPDDLTRFVDATGASRAVAALVLAGLVDVIDRRPSARGAFVSYRDSLRLKSREIERAQEELRSLSPAVRAALLDAVPDDPVAMWDPIAHSAHRAALWNRLVGERITIADDVVSRCASELPGLREPAAWLRVLARPTTAPALTIDARWGVLREAELAQLDDAGRPVFDDAGTRTCFDEEAARALAQLVAWAFVALPVGDPLRARIPEVIELVRARLDSPTLLFDGGSLELPKLTGSYEERLATRIAQLDAYGGVRFSLLDEADGDEALGGETPQHGRDLGLVLLAIDYHSIRAILRPSLMKRGLTDAERALLARSPMRAIAEAWRSAAFDAFAERARHTPVAAGAYEASPTASVPELVEDVARALSCSSDAAAYYLQLLAAPAPTDENVLRWNGWKSARLDAASAELETRGRVVRGQRARAGRRAFLPGEWLDLRKPSFPIERWKLERLRGTLDETGRAHFGLGAALAPAPIHALFASAWRDVVEGRGPALRDTRETLGRRGRASGTATKQAVAKKTVTKKTVAKKTVTKKTVTKKTVAKKTVAKKTVAKKTVAKKTVAKKTVAKKKGNR